MSDNSEQLQLLRSISVKLQQQVKIQIHDTLDRLQSHPKYRGTKSLIPYGRKVYSQNDEDGILQEIFKRIGIVYGSFVEFGVETGLENNTRGLLHQGWSGLWIESQAERVATMHHAMSRTVSRGQLRIIHSLVTRDNINDLIASCFSQNEIDLLSVDVDGNDYHLVEALTCVRPRVMVIEYNAKFAPPIEYCMAYNPSHVWNGSDNFGVSLKFLELHLRPKGYVLVGCNITGANAFFVRDDLAGDHFQGPFTAEQHYEPARYYLTGIFSGHVPSFETLENAVELTSPIPS
jgi:hypothetical protein